MSNVANNVKSTLIWADKVCDYIPFVSTVTNFVDVFEKIVLLFDEDFTIRSNLNTNHYLYHIEKKHEFRCLTLLIPVLGNVIIAIHDLSKNFNKGLQNRKAQDLGLDHTQLPNSLVQRRKIIKDKAVENTRADIQSLEKEIAALNSLIKNFKNIIADPHASLEFAELKRYAILSQINLKSFDGLELQDKIYSYWRLICAKMHDQNIGLMLVFLHTRHPNVKLQQKFASKAQELFALQDQLVQLGEESYRTYLEDMGEEKILQEAKKIYLSTFSCSKRGRHIDRVSQMNSQEILSALREKVKKNYDDHIIEMKLLIPKLEALLAKR